MSLNIDNLITLGLKNTIQLRNNGGFSVKGPWSQLTAQGNNFDRWYLGEIAAAEYSIFVDYNQLNKEIIKCTVVATLNIAKVNVYSRLSTNNSIAVINATVNDSYVNVTIAPIAPQVSESKFIYTVQYFENQNLID